MGNVRKIVGVALAVAVVAGVMVYLLIPKSGTTTNNVVVNQPQTPTNGGSSNTPSGSSGTGGGSGSNPSPQTPPGRPAKAHGQNSHGPKHVVCLPVKDHDGNGVSQYQGANQYRGQCPVGSAQGSQVHGQGHGHGTNAAPQAAVSARLLHAAPASTGRGNR